MNKLTRILACFLLAALSFYIVPKEFVHTLFGHEDTADHIPASSSSGGAAFCTHHTHCELLNFETDFFYEHSPEAAIKPAGVFFSYSRLPLISAKIPVAAYICLRGPPSC